MTTITIPKELAGKRELVIIPRKEYEEFLKFRLKKLEEIQLTAPQKRALRQARKNLSQGKSLTLYELKQKLGIKS